MPSGYDQTNSDPDTYTKKSGNSEFMNWALGKMKEKQDSESQSSSDSSKKDPNQPVDLNRKKTILPGQPGSTSPGFRGYQ